MESQASTTTSASDDKIHMHLLETALKKTTSKCVSSFKFSLLKRQFEAVYKKDPKALQKLHEGVATELTTNIQEEIAVMFEEENIAEFMAKLDEMKAQADGVEEDLMAWRPSGNPEEDARAHVQPIHFRHLQQLQKVFDQLQSQNTLLQKNLKKQHDKLMQSRSAMLDHLNSWKQANCLSAEDRLEVENFVKKL